MIEKEHFDERLADKFRKELENYEAEYDPKDWEKFMPSLQKPVFVSVWRNPVWKKAVLVAATISLLIVGYWVMQTPGEAKKVAIEKQVSKIKNKQPLDSTESISSQKENTISYKQDKDKNLSNKIPDKTETNKDKNNNVTKNENNNLINSLVEKNKTDINSVGEFSKDFGIEKNKEEGVLTNNYEGDNNVTQTKIASENKTLSLNNSEEKKLLVIEEITIDSVDFQYTMPELVKNIDNQLRKVAPHQSLPLITRGLSIGLIVNPLAYKNSVDSDISLESGLQINIPVLRNLSINTGLLLSRQQMNFRHETRTVSNISMTNPDNNTVGIATGRPSNKMSSFAYNAHNDWGILNIPIDLQYDIVHGDRLKLFVKGGISNYTYFNEKYQFITTSSTITNDFYLIDNAVIYTVTTESVYEDFSRIDLVSGLNLSTGVEYLFSKHLFMQLSPFLRLPIRKVGHETLSFNTYGMTVLLGYRK